MQAGDRQTVARIIAKEDGVFFGVDLIFCALAHVDKEGYCDVFCEDGEWVTKGQVICSMKALFQALLLIERVLLNILQRASGIATQTRRFVQVLSDDSIKILDTRKTIPGLRVLEKAAVVAGGGYNHRMGLSDMVLIKENHLSVLQQQHRLGALPELLASHKQKHPECKIEIEVETLEQLRSFSFEHVDYILCDNFSMEMLDEAIAICKKRRITSELEVSGNVTLETISRYRGVDIQRISVGALTHSVKVFDLSLVF